MAGPLWSRVGLNWPAVSKNTDVPGTTPPAVRCLLHRPQGKHTSQSRTQHALWKFKAWSCWQLYPKGTPVDSVDALPTSFLPEGVIPNSSKGINAGRNHPVQNRKSKSLLGSAIMYQFTRGHSYILDKTNHVFLSGTASFQWERQATHFCDWLLI